VRVDKYLWCVRIFKTRSQAAMACKTGKVLLNNNPVKPALEIKIGDELSVKENPIWRKYKITESINSRVGAKLVNNYINEVTSKEELEKFETMKLAASFDRDRGTGRPTKKDRRELDNLEW
jgi:ribosome-associated heat shock protein Hsp15